ncbi:hypothetical protein [Anaeromyxobacter dehalogenans]|uniref:Uncharacterized protein n=1 Tax=Anaeromyxobacter dehalogenans (strain 2CP-C) TaxID=290397 RepID=Q2IMS6_ANADE|nr:hypothetical protein [Anaeromyxobacter dehalogenans]ABC80106.1 hypothetical protein Adeh_0330 [Anaeromyxobacter dehalogenans 2CP-C]
MDRLKQLKIQISLQWYELILIGVTAGLLAFGVWALIDTLLISSPVAAWRFLALFVIWSLPGIAVLAFVRPRTAAEAAQEQPTP